MILPEQFILTWKKVIWIEGSIIFENLFGKLLAPRIKDKNPIDLNFTIKHLQISFHLLFLF